MKPRLSASAGASASSAAPVSSPKNTSTPSTALVPALPAQASNDRNSPEIKCCEVSQHMGLPMLSAVGNGAAFYATGSLLGWSIFATAPISILFFASHLYVQYRYIALPATYPDSKYAVSEFQNNVGLSANQYSRMRNIGESLVLTFSTAGEMVAGGMSSALKSGGYIAPGVATAYMELIGHTHAEAAKLIAESNAPVEITYFGKLSSLLTLNYDWLTPHFDLKALAVESMPLLRAGVALTSGYTAGTIGATFISPWLIPAGIFCGWFGAQSEFRKAKDFEQKLMEESIHLDQRKAQYSCLGKGLYLVTNVVVSAAGKILSLPADALSICLPPSVVTYMSNTTSAICEGISLGVEGRETLLDVKTLQFVEDIPTYAMAAMGSVATIWGNHSDLAKAKRQEVNGKKVGTEVRLEEEFTTAERTEASCGRIAKNRLSQLFCCGNKRDRQPLLVGSSVAPNMQTAAAVVGAHADSKSDSAPAPIAVVIEQPPPIDLTYPRTDVDDAPRPNPCTQFWNTITCGFFCSSTPKQAQSAAPTQYQSLRQ